MDTLSKDFIGLPIIISDYDALLTPGNSSASTHTAHQETSPHQQTRNANPSFQGTWSSQGTGNGAQETTQRWKTGFTEFTDTLWSKMTSNTKQKLREACVEVLRRTEDEKPDMDWEVDDDAWYLD